MSMKVHYLGTGAAEGIPALFCRCEFCTAARKEGLRRSRAQVVVDGKISIDFPPDAFLHACESGEDFSALKYVLVTHSHMDHFYAHDFILRGYKYARGMTEEDLHIFGNEEVGQVFAECTRRELKEEIASHLHFHRVRAFEPFFFGDYRAVALPARHTSAEPFVFLLGKGETRYLHLCDTGLLPEETYTYLARTVKKPVDLITFDCTFLWERSSTYRRHMGLADNREVLMRLQADGVADAHTRRVMTHFSHHACPDPESLARAEGVYGGTAAYDGYTLYL